MDITTPSRRWAHPIVPIFLTLLLFPLSLPAQEDLSELERRGRIYVKEWKQDSALILFERILALDPDHGGGLLGRGTVRIYRREVSDGEADVNRALQILGDTCAECYVQLSIAASLRGETADALLHADRAVTLAPDRADGYRQRGDARLQAGAGNPLPDIDRAIGLDSLDPRSWTLRSYYYLLGGGYLSARGDARRAADLAPEWGLPWYLLGKIAAARGDAAEGIDYLSRAIELGYRSGEIYFERAGLYADIGELVMAEADYTSSLELQPEIAATYGNRANTRYALEDMDGTCEDVALALRYGSDVPEIVDWVTRLQGIICDSSSINYYLHRGIAAFNREKFDEAIGHYETGLRKFPGSPTLRWARGNAKLMLGDLAAADAEYRYTFDSIDRHVAELARANVSGNYDMFGGLESLKNATIASLYLQRAEVAAARGETEEAYALVDAAIPYAPRGSDIAARLTTQRGIIAMEEGKREDAETYFRAALRDAPNAPAPTLLLSTILLDRAIERGSGATTTTRSITIGLDDRRAGRPLNATIPIATTRVEGTISRETVEEAIILLSRLIAVTPEVGAAWYLRSVARRLIDADGGCDDLNEARRLGHAEATQDEGC